VQVKDLLNLEKRKCVDRERKEKVRKSTTAAYIKELHLMSSKP